MNTSDSNKVFDYRALRLVMGLIALALPIVVSAVSSTQLTSISASYYTEARDVFVGLLFFVAAFLSAYNGHSHSEAWISNVACVAALVVAVSPTACDSCESNVWGRIHYIAAVILFAILAYFCLIPFRKRTKGHSGKKGRRDRIYLVCGWAIVTLMIGALIVKLAMTDALMATYRVTYWVEFGALWAFGIAWLVAGKSIPWLVDEDEQFKVFG